MATKAVLAKVQELLAAPSIYSGLKTVAEAYVQAVGTQDEKKAAEKLLAELREDVQTIDEVLEFFRSDAGKKVFGAEKAAELEALAVKTKKAGGKYCFCPACQAGAALLAMEKEMLEG
ncbi:MAG: heat-shock protein Hsp90 [Succiniclasticum sp.]|jgi:hypothetical protein